MHTTSAGHRAADAAVVTLPNGLRFVAIPLPHLQTASVGVYVRAGSAHEPRALNGISHFVEHMVFKGTAARDVHRINLDAERLGAEVNAHTDKDHTAYYMRGRGEHAVLFVQMLADIVQNATFPEAELAREREVLLQEAAEVADDPMDTAYQLFDHACWGLHPAAQAVIGPAGNIRRLQRADLVRWVSRHHTGGHLVVVAAGPIDTVEIVARGRDGFRGAAARAGRSRRATGMGRRHALAPAAGQQPDAPGAGLPDRCAQRRRPGRLRWPRPSSATA